MSNRAYAAAALLAALALAPTPAFAAGEILITHAKANAGNVTPGDAPGYPVTISIPGTFQLASNLFVAANKIGIQVTGKNVTIDLNGFSMQGSNVAWYGITGGVDGVTIRNGTIDSFKFDGIIGTGDRWVVENMQVVENGRQGVDLFAAGGELHRIFNSTISGNGGDGVRCGRCVVEGNIVAENAARGIYGNVAVIGNYIYNNVGSGLYTGNASSGFAHNVLTANNGGGTGDQVFLTPPLHPNICVSVVC